MRHTKYILLAILALLHIISEISDPCPTGPPTTIPISPSPTPPPTTSIPGPCEGSCNVTKFKGDNHCDDGNNNCGCEYDGGDCCNPDANKKYCKECECLHPKNE